MRAAPILCLTVLVAASASSGVASAAPNGTPSRISTLCSWRVHDAAKPDPGAEPWTVEDVAGFLDRYPSAYLDLGYRDGYPPGNRHWVEKGAEVDRLQTVLTRQKIQGHQRICITERPDMLVKQTHERSCDPSQGGGGCGWEGNMDGSFGEAETVVVHSGTADPGGAGELRDSSARWEQGAWRHRLLVLRPGRANEEERRIVANDGQTLTTDSAWTDPPEAGDRYEIRSSFDPAWVKRVPRTVHEATVRNLWTSRRNVCGRPSAPAPCASPAEPLDPFHAANRRAWPRWVDRTAIGALATSSAVPALYGPIRDAKNEQGGPPWSDPYFSVSSVVMDVSNPAYRAWRIRYLMYKLRDYGLDPGEPACIIMSYKPGWYTHYDEAEHGPSGHACAVAGSGLYTGPAQVCSDGSAPGGPFVAGLYGPGEFEDSINAYLRETIAALASNGWSDLRIILNERPTFTRAKWAILDDDVRRHPVVIGEWQGPIDPKLAELSKSRPLAEDPVAPAPELPEALDPSPAPTPTATSAPQPASPPTTAPSQAPPPSAVPSSATSTPLAPSPRQPASRPVTAHQAPQAEPPQALRPSPTPSAQQPASRPTTASPQAPPPQEAAVPAAPAPTPSESRSKANGRAGWSPSERPSNRQLRKDDTTSRDAWRR